ncbi:uncharacterized protein LOC130777184 [Actinidia eriantha]|uniref:uncharacterized protein LOC130777184 n=1 Tax=Actinidia eriantha TaxID=165200 RepID=UPI0025909C12|nr:uncharacterized protein LOC130777184 [Actinidia eriantha]
MGGLSFSASVQLNGYNAVRIKQEPGTNLFARNHYLRLRNKAIKEEVEHSFQGEEEEEKEVSSSNTAILPKLLKIVGKPGTAQRKEQASLPAAKVESSLPASWQQKEKDKGLRLVKFYWLFKTELEIAEVVSSACANQVERLTDKEQLVVQIEKQYPGDVGVLAAFLFNYVKLNPGEALYLGANELHAYLRGECVKA